MTAWRQPDFAGDRGGFGLGDAESHPGGFGPLAGYADDANIENGYLKLSDCVGIGYESQATLYAIVRELAA